MIRLLIFNHSLSIKAVLLIHHCTQAAPNFTFKLTRFVPIIFDFVLISMDLFELLNRFFPLNFHARDRGKPCK